MTHIPLLTSLLALCACIPLPGSRIRTEQAAPPLLLDSSDDRKAFLVRVCYDGENADLMEIELDVGRIESPNSLEVSLTNVGRVQLLPDHNEGLSKPFQDPERVYAWMCLDGFRVEFVLTGLYSGSIEVGWMLAATAIQNDDGEELIEDEIVIEIVELES